MDIISRYINAITLIYNNPDSFVSIVDEKSNVMYLSDAMRKLVTKDSTTMPNSLDKFDQLPEKVITEVRNLNDTIFKSGKTAKYLYIVPHESEDFILFRGTKSPIYNSNGQPIAILTIQHKLKPIDVENIDNNENDYCFSIPNHKLSDIEQLILFYISFGFTHGEAYQFILKFNDAKLKHENFKYYCKHILKKFNAESMKHIINNTAELRTCRFIPRKLIKDGVFLLKSC